MVQKRATTDAKVEDIKKSLLPVEKSPCYHEGSEGPTGTVQRGENASHLE